MLGSYGTGVASPDYPTNRQEIHFPWVANLVSRPTGTPFFVLRFAFNIIHGGGYIERKPKNKKTG